MPYIWELWSVNYYNYWGACDKPFLKSFCFLSHKLVINWNSCARFTKCQWILICTTWSWKAYIIFESNCKPRGKRERSCKILFYELLGFVNYVCECKHSNPPIFLSSHLFFWCILLVSRILSKSPGFFNNSKINVRVGQFPQFSSPVFFQRSIFPSSYFAKEIVVMWYVGVCPGENLLVFNSRGWNVCE